MSLGDNIKRLREEAGLSRKELARLASTTEKMIQRIEGDDSDVGVSKIKKIVIALGCSADQALFDEDELGPDGDLAGLFQQLKRMQGRDRETAKEVIRALVMQHQNKELLAG